MPTAVTTIRLLPSACSQVLSASGSLLSPQRTSKGMCVALFPVLFSHPSFLPAAFSPRLRDTYIKAGVERTGNEILYVQNISSSKMYMYLCMCNILIHMD